MHPAYVPIFAPARSLPAAPPAAAPNIKMPASQFPTQVPPPTLPWSAKAESHSKTNPAAFVISASRSFTSPSDPRISRSSVSSISTSAPDPASALAANPAQTAHRQIPSPTPKARPSPHQYSQTHPAPRPAHTARGRTRVVVSQPYQNPVIPSRVRRSRTESRDLVFSFVFLRVLCG